MKSTNKKAKKQAEKIPADKRREEIEKNLKDATDQIEKSSKELDKKIDIANEAMDSVLDIAPNEHHVKLSSVVLGAKQLLTQLKDGADVNDIISKIKNLK